MSYDGTLKFDTSINTTGFQNGASKIGVAAKLGIGAIAGMAAAAAGSIIAMGAAALNCGMQFESAFAGVRKTVDATEEEFEELKNGILDMSERIPATANDIAAIAESAGQLGIATEDILSFTETMINLGVATNLTADEASTALARFANIMGTSSDQYENLGSTIVALGNNFATTEADIVSMATRMASTGSIIGLTEAQVFAVSTALSSVGIESEAGGSAISKLMKDMETSAKGFRNASSVIKSTGMSMRELELLADADSKAFKSIAQSMSMTSDELRDCMASAKDLESFANVAGMTADQFVEAWGDDAVLAMEAFLSGLNDTERLGKSAVETLAEMGITEVRMSNAVLALAAADGLLSETLATANTAWDENSALTKEAEQRYATLESKVAMLKNGVTNLGIAIYDDAEESLKSLADHGTKYIDQLAEAFQQDGFSGITEKAGGIIGEIITGISAELPQIIEMGVTMLTTLVSSISSNSALIASSAAEIIYTLCDGILTMLPMVAVAAIELIAKLIGSLSEHSKDIATSAKDCIMDFVNSINDNIGDVATCAFDIVLALINAITEMAPELIPTAVNIIMTLLNTMYGRIGDVILAAYQLVFALIQGITASLPKLAEMIPMIISSFIEGIVENLPQIIQTGIEVMLAFTNGCLTMEVSIVKMVLQLISSLKGTFQKFDWSEIGKNILAGIGNGIKNGVGTLIQTAKDALGGVVDSVKDLFGIHSPSTLMEDEVGEQLPPGIGIGFENAMPRLKSDVAAAMNDLTTSIQSDMAVTYRPQYSTGYPQSSVYNTESSYTSNDTYNIYTQAKNASDARSLSEELAHLRSREKAAKGGY